MQKPAVRLARWELPALAVSLAPEWDWVEVAVPRDTEAMFLRLAVGIDDGF